MPITPINQISGLFLFEPKIFKDQRGYFFESYNKENFKSFGLNCEFVQDNQSYSNYGVIRGLHFQRKPKAQIKLVRVIKGNILDVAVDLRKNSPTFKKYFSVELSEENNLQLFIPQGFAHGFSVLSQSAIVAYKCSDFYNKESETGIVFNDSQLNIDWKIPTKKQIVSDKDLELPSLNKLTI